MWLASISQLGGIVGGVGQALAISAPLTQRGIDYNEVADAETLQVFEEYANDGENESLPSIAADIEAKWDQYQQTHGSGRTSPNDAAIWATIVALATSVILMVGRYGLIQTLSTVLVASFTLLTMLNVFFLQDQPDWRVSLGEFFSGLSFRLPQSSGGINPIGTALATFGIIGVGATELVVYPYWCLEKGYAKFAGKNDGSLEWQRGPPDGCV